MFLTGETPKKRMETRLFCMQKTRKIGMVFLPDMLHARLGMTILKWKEKRTFKRGKKFLGKYQGRSSWVDFHSETVSTIGLVKLSILNWLNYFNKCNTIHGGGPPSPTQALISTMMVPEIIFHHFYQKPNRAILVESVLVSNGTQKKRFQGLWSRIFFTWKFIEFSQWNLLFL